MGAFLRKYRGVLIFLLVVIIAVSAYAFSQRNSSDTVSQFQTAKIERGNLVATIGATGTVRAKQTATLNWQATGTVDTVNVKVGDNVPSGFVMAYLKKTSLPQSIIMAEADLANAQTTLDNLLNSNSALAQAEQDLANAKQAVEDAQKDVTKLDYRRYSDDMLKQAKDELILAKRNVSRAEDFFKLLKDRPNGDADKAQAELNLINARTTRDQKQAVIDWYLGTSNELDAAKYRAALSVALAQEADAQRVYDNLKDGPDAEQLPLLTAQLDAAQAKVAAFTVTAPFDGVVAELKAKTGSSINAGEIAVTIADISSWLVVTTDVTEIDVVKLKNGQPVTVTLDAIPDVKMKGKVLAIGQNYSENQGDIVYKVTVVLTDINPAMRWGMTAEVKFE